MALTDDTCYDAITAGAESIAAALASAPDADVPGCPGWDVAKLALHLGLIYTWAGQQVRERRTEPLDRGTLPLAPQGPERVPWLTAAGASVVDALRAAQDDDPAGGWRDRMVTARFWRRRMAHETAVHRVDADDALGRPPTLGPELATDGVDEIMELFLPYATADRVPPGSLRLAASDAARGWNVSAAGGALAGGPASGAVPADGVTITAPTPELLLLCWGRRHPEPEQIDGDADLAREWLACFRF